MNVRIVTILYSIISYLLTFIDVCILRRIICVNEILLRSPVRLPSLLYTASLLASLTACAVGPDYKSPPAPQPQSYGSEALPEQTESASHEGGAAQKFVPDQEIPAEWWTLFHSEALNHMITKAIKANPDLMAAQAALRVAQENTASAEGYLFPTLDGHLDTVRQKTSGAGNGGRFPGNIYTLHTASVSVSYGLDIFGGTRRAIEQLSSEEEYQRFQLEAAYLSLSANVVAATIQEASLRGQIDATKEIIESETKAFEITQKQFDLGGIAKAPVVALKAQLEQTKASLPGLESRLSQTRHLLSVLMGQLPNEAPEDKFELTSLKLPELLPVSLPSKLVEQRPDIRAADAHLHAASAAIGVAEADRLPQIALTADLGSQANNLGKLLSSGTSFWSAGFSIAQPLFDGGVLAHKQSAAEAAYDVAAAQYRKTVLAAFKDVADTLRALEEDAKTLNARVAAEAAAADSLHLTQEQYNAGAISYLPLLSAEQSDAEAKLSLVEAEAQRYTDTAALFQALGGGWMARTDTITQNDADHLMPSAGTYGDLK